VNAQPMTMVRHSQIINVRPEMRDEYLRLHADVWPDVLARLSASRVQNYSIFIHGDLLIAYFEYAGDDYEADMAAIAADPVTQEWWKLTDPCQRSVDGAEEGSGWADAREIFHLD
jgi:L-rhamnose mutarotase